jgi:hypothetical protein
MIAVAVVAPALAMFAWYKKLWADDQDTALAFLCFGACVIFASVMIGITIAIATALPSSNSRPYRPATGEAKESD